MFPVVLVNTKFYITQNVSPSERVDRSVVIMHTVVRPPLIVFRLGRVLGGGGSVAV